MKYFICIAVLVFSFSCKERKPSDADALKKEDSVKGAFVLKGDIPSSVKKFPIAVVAVDALNIRSEPLAGSPVVSLLSSGHELRVLDAGPNGEVISGLRNIWYKVSFIKDKKTATGYAFGAFLKFYESSKDISGIEKKNMNDCSWDNIIGKRFDAVQKTLYADHHEKSDSVVCGNFTIILNTQNPQLGVDMSKPVFEDFEGTRNDYDLIIVENGVIVAAQQNFANPGMHADAKIVRAVQEGTNLHIQIKCGSSAVVERVPFDYKLDYCWQDLHMILNTAKKKIESIYTFSL